MNRHERRKAAKQMRQEVPAATLPRVMQFIDAFRDAPNDADIEIRAGTSEQGVAAILVSISGGGDHVMMAKEARVVANIMEDAMRAHPNDPEAATLPNIIMALRHACDKADGGLTGWR